MLDLTGVSQLPIADVLEKCHPDYDKGKITKYRDFYVGGERFETRKEKYIRPRQIEENDAGGRHKNERFKCYKYRSHIGGIIDNLTGSATASAPRIDVNDHGDPRAKYWLGLNSDMNGRGQDFLSVASDRFVQSCVQHRAYLSIVFPPQAQDGSRDKSLYDAKTRGRYDAFICTLDADDVDDWQRDKDDELQWVRTHIVRHKRSVAYAPQDLEKHCWTFYTQTHYFEYTATRKLGDMNWPDKAVATQTAAQKHGLDALPIIPIVPTPNLFVMDRVIGTAEALYNREGSREFALDKGALTLPVYKAPDRPQSIVLADGSAIYVPPEGDFYFRGPDGATFSALKQSCDDLRQDLNSAIQEIAKAATQQTQAPRQSGAAKQQDKGPMYHLLLLLVEPVRDSFQRAFNLIAAVREETSLEPTFKGMDQFDDQDPELLINKTLTFVSIPDMLPSAKRYAVLTTALDTYPDAPDEEKDKWKKEAASMPTMPADSEAAQASLDQAQKIAAAPVPAPGIRDGKGQPAGMQADRGKTQTNGKNK